MLPKQQPRRVLPWCTVLYHDLPPHYRFWYLSFVACVWNSTTCVWESPSHTSTLNYELTLVNGDPNAEDHNPFEYQFSFDKQVRAAESSGVQLHSARVSLCLHSLITLINSGAAFLYLYFLLYDLISCKNGRISSYLVNQKLFLIFNCPPELVRVIFLCLAMFLSVISVPNDTVPTLLILYSLPQSPHAFRELH